MTLCGARIARLFPAVLAGLAALALAAPPGAAQAPREELPMELWEEYPLDPTQRGDEPTQEPAGQPPTTPTVDEVPARPAEVQTDAAASDDGATPWTLLMGVTLGVSGAVGILLGIVLARRRGPDRGVRPPVRAFAAASAVTGSVRSASAGVRAAGGRGVGSLASGAASAAGALGAAVRRRPSKEVAALRSHSGVLSAYTGRRAEPAAPPRPSRGDDSSAEEAPAPPAPPKPPRAPRRARKKVAPPGAPPPKKELPGLAPPKKERPVTSGLPPGKAVPKEKKVVPPAAPAAAPAEAEAAPRPAPAPPAPAAAPAEAEAAPRPAPSPSGAAYVDVGWEECQIEYWPTRSASGGLSDFYALAARPEGETYIAAVSQPFRWGRNEPPGESGEKADAHAALVDLLLAEGWQPSGSGPTWYQLRFRRRLLIPGAGEART